MKGLFEAALNLEVTNGTEEVYKKAFEQENEQYLTKHTLKDDNGHIVKDELESVWNGSCCHIDISYSMPARKNKLTISIVSGTLQNVKDVVTDYQMFGAELIHKNWEWLDGLLWLSRCRLWRAFTKGRKAIKV